ncbi:hypothetical protein [Microbacterium oxydans]|uniref:hypothetical protein n=1 Tax=Microbacterium oxydans TaxID=82380 RepID=UPI0022B1CE88|nr:hypothetical protein [Microbacterium oxydans]MCZ4301340.1 hypothetical protein [Microbacterium oxydans]
MTGQLVWMCDVCQHPIADGKGAVFVRSSDRRAYRKSSAERRQKRDAFYAANPDGLLVESLSELRDSAPPAPWLAMHHKCDKTPGDCAYWFDVARIRTLLAVITWTHHLLGKGWLGETAWDDLIGRVAYDPINAAARGEASS